MVKRNIAANYLAGAWSALMSIAFVPVYVRYLGVEAYGLVGVYASLQVWFALLDMGLAPAFSREVARFKAGAESSSELMLLFRSLEVVYVSIAVLLTLGFSLASPWIAVSWLRATTLEPALIRDALVLIAVAAALRWVGVLYRGALIGLQRQVWLSGSNSIFATLRGAGAAIVVAKLSHSIVAFFVFQIVVCASEVLVLAIGTRRKLPAAAVSSLFSLSAIRRIWRFAAGMGTIAVLSILLSQVDKLLLSKLLPLADFGVYTLAFTLASGLNLMTTPVGNAAYPRLTELVTRKDGAALGNSYHAFCRIVALVLGPICFVVVAFAYEIVRLWTQDPVVSSAAAPLLSTLIVGNLLNGLLHIPYNLQLAHGWTRFTVCVNTVSLVVLVPLMYVGILRFGAIAAPWAWIAVNASYLLVAMPLMHRVLLPGEKWRWYINDIALPLGAALFGVAAVYALTAHSDGFVPSQAVAKIILALAAGFIGGAIAVPEVRVRALRWAARAGPT
jgi:O-antigen/teichoic acid export membrane protein